ncbi:MAG TPA: reverse transcriptase domain-containing protein [Gammaproteobacteria bacterium]|nr:reverse transcriptase domain-containing protein [Gammaproteobacteria bacterium]
MPKKKNLPPYQRLCSPNFLHDAWQKIYENGLKSDSSKTRESVRLFKEKERQNIDKIYRAIKTRKTNTIFDGAHGITAGEKKRPIVLASVEGRVVQRAILDVLQDIPATFKYLNAPGSYGALKSENDNKKGVKPAIEAAIRAIENGADHFYQSDIKSFFTQIPRKEVIAEISSYVEDSDFISILEAATNLEIKNINRIPIKHRKFFDYSTIGTPQGCCLSPLLGNILLYEFDVAMNQNGITCIRYLDDFMVLGKGWRAVQEAFNKGASILGKLNLDVYMLSEKKTKAVSGMVTKGFDFLGVEIKGKNIKPNRDSRNRLLTAIREMTNETFKQKFDGSPNKKQHNYSLIETLGGINNKVKGWGNQYSFCNEEAIWGSVDAEINNIVRGYLGRYSEVRKKLDEKSMRRLLGIHLVAESKKDPIKFRTEDKLDSLTTMLNIAPS